MEPSTTIPKEPSTTAEVEAFTLPATNMGKWQYFMRDCPSPDSWIEFGYYYITAASLQRRVWFGSAMQPLFTNIYGILVGRAGLGKGNVITPVAGILRELKIERLPVKNASIATPKPLTPEEKKKHEEIETMLLEGKSAKELRDAVKRELDLVIPVAANATTYEALVKAMVEAIRAVSYVNAEGKRCSYGHSSLCFCLTELASLLKENTKNVVNFLLEAYDCGDRYEYDTKTKGKDVIRKLCLNFLGGTTPHFMESIFNDSILDEGFSSRTFFLYESKNRFHKIFITNHTEEQQKCRATIVEHVRKLSQIYGQFDFSQEAKDFLQHWWEVEQDSRADFRLNHSSKLDAYYARKQLHVMKMAAIMYYSEAEFDTNGKCSMIVPLEYVKLAMYWLAEREKKMHYALTFGGDNPHFKVGQKVVRYLGKYPEGLPFNKLFIEFHEYAKKPDFEEILSTMVAVGSLEGYMKEIDGKSVAWYALPKQNLTEKE